MNEPLPAQTLKEMEYYLMVTPCPACSKGPWVIDQTRPGDQNAPTVVDAHCKDCEHAQRFSVRCRPTRAEVGPQAEVINPTDAPSRIIDLRQWLSLFYMLVESASSQDEPTEARLLGYRAALCLAEALKFYDADGELPPESAFFTEESLKAYRENPDKFVRQKLQDMQARLPHLDVMATNVSRDQRAHRKWWQFWR